MKLIITALVVILSLITGVCQGFQCEKEGIFGITSHISCPGIGDPSDAQFCCGSKENVFCCQNPLGLDDEEFEEIAKRLPAILGTIFAIVIGLIVVCVICCCCCPFCLLHKRRTRGTIHNPNPPAAQPVMVTSVPPQSQPGYAPVQMTAYQPQQQPYPAQPYPPQPGFAPPTGAPYPVGSMAPQHMEPVPGGDNPPPYAEKQMAFNPNY